MNAKRANINNGVNHHSESTTTMLSVTQLATACGVSRTTVLYYERQGLLQPAYRSDNGYRWYGAKQQQQLQAILAYRGFGISTKEIAPLLHTCDADQQEQALQRQFQRLETEVLQLRQQQRAIMMLLKRPQSLTAAPVDKAGWVAIMQDLGFSEHDMQQWHRRFEQMAPEDHLRFLQSLQLDEHQIKQIRDHSR